MGMYTKINIILKIKNDTPEEIKEIIKSLFYDDIYKLLMKDKSKLPNHKFFESEMRIWFPNSGGSYYFTGTANSDIKYRSVDNQMVLHIDTDFKNYNNEIKYFIDWITPYIDASNNEFLGYSRYEEDINPTLYFYKNNQVVSFVNNNL